MLNVLTIISENIVFRTVGLISITYQFLRKLLKYNEDKIEEQRATVYNVGFSPEDLNEGTQPDKNDKYLQGATAALAIVNAYSLISGQQTPLSAAVTCGWIGKSAYDMMKTRKKR